MQEEKPTGIGTPVVETKPEAPTFDALKAQMQAAIADGNDADVARLGKQMVKFKSDIEKTEGERMKKEGEAMAGDREKIAKSIYKFVSEKYPELTEVLAKVKARGFTFTVDHRESDKGQLDPSGSVKVTGGCVLTVPTVRKTGGGGGGSTGALKEQTGLSRHELLDKFATPEEVAEIQKAYDSTTNRPDSARYSAEKPVIKRILADNPQLVKR